MSNLALQYIEMCRIGFGDDSFMGRLKACGREMKREPFTLAEQADIERLQRFHRFQRQQCFYNCQVASFFQAHSGPLVYCEGYAARCHLPVGVLHGWLTLNGKVVELTTPEFEHYYGIEIEQGLVREYLARAKQHQPMLQDEQFGMKYASYLLGTAPRPNDRFGAVEREVEESLCQAANRLKRSRRRKQ